MHVTGLSAGRIRFDGRRASSVECYHAADSREVLIEASPEVGANYQDHVGVPVTRKLMGVKGLHGADKGLAALKHGFDYFVR